MIKKLTQTDKVLAVPLLLSTLFWSLSKIHIPQDELVPWHVFYGVTWPLWVAVTLGLTIYFLIRWINHKFNFYSLHLAGFILGIITLCIMRFIY